MIRVRACPAARPGPNAGKLNEGGAPTSCEARRSTVRFSSGVALRPRCSGLMASSSCSSDGRGWLSGGRAACRLLCPGVPPARRTSCFLASLAAALLLLPKERKARTGIAERLPARAGAARCEARAGAIMMRFVRVKLRWKGRDTQRDNADRLTKRRGPEDRGSRARDWHCPRQLNPPDPAAALHSTCLCCRTRGPRLTTSMGAGG